MKNDLHPKYDICEVTCACGNSFKTRSIRPVIKVEICAACHPFFTGKQRFTDTAGRVEKFQKKFAATEGKMVERKVKATAVKSVTPRHTAKRKVLSSAPLKKDDKAAKPAPKVVKAPEAK
ncbi:MAG TPA: 50S ribosomal protein L31 [Elusimicrobia bacterium]|nr:MAG: 50S ribosomal protein L31 [Elusimicrobia bacterium GWF2_62_30]HBA60333.1 50S ribosomal protein L31 [Elusimicrobiota bacterium]